MRGSDLHGYGIAQAAVLLLDAPDADFGQAWNRPCAPTRSLRALLAMGAVAPGTLGLHLSGHLSISEDYRPHGAPDPT